jgi:uncharacterized membrane protein YfcA
MGAAVVGLIVGLVVGLTSMGGGALLTPALVYVLGIPASTAIGSDVLIASLTKVFGGGAYALRREVHWSMVLRLATGSLPGALLGKKLLSLAPAGSVDGLIIYGLGIALVLAGLFTLQRLRMKTAEATGPMPHTAIIIGLGFLTGVIVTVTSVGSGSLLMVVLMRIVPLRLTKLVGTDLVHAIILSAFATVLHARTGWLNYSLAAQVLVGAIPGVLIGARLATVLPDRPLRAVLAVVLATIGITLLVQGPKRPASTAPVAALTVSSAEVSR